MKLSNQFEQETRYKVQFWHECAETKKISDTTVLPKVKLTRISDKGQVNIFWNTNMNFTNLTHHDVSVRILPGSELSIANHLNITNYRVSQTTNTTLSI